MSESDAGIAPDGGGPKIRTKKIVGHLLDDGTFVDVHEQVVVVADSDGNEIDFTALSALPQLLDTFRDVRALLAALLEHTEGRPVSAGDVATYRTHFEEDPE